MIVEKEITVTLRFKWSAVICEFLGACLISYTCGMTYVNATDRSLYLTAAPHIAHAIATALMYMVGKEISGGHFNPAVSLATVLTGNMKVLLFIIYFIFQVMGAILGALFIYWLRLDNSGTYSPYKSVPVPNRNFHFWQLWGIETAASFFVIMTYLLVNQWPKEKTPSAAASIGLSIVASATSSSFATNVGLNPVRVIGPSLVFNQFAQVNAWIYYLGPAIAALLAVFFLRYMIQDHSALQELIVVPYIKYKAARAAGQLAQAAEGGQPAPQAQQMEERKAPEAQG